jgi:hypothetical protein
LADVINSLKAGKPSSTIGVIEDLVHSFNFDLFLEKRYNRWNEIVVHEYEEGVKKGEIPRPNSGPKI